MRISVDTNVLLRVVVPGDEVQQRLAIDALRADIAAAIRLFMKTSNVVLNRPAVEAGLDLLDAGGDFADGVVAYDGLALGGETFVSFDRKAVKLLTQRGYPARLL